MMGKIAAIGIAVLLLGCGLRSNSPFRIASRMIDQTNQYPRPNAEKAMVYFYHDPASYRYGAHYIYQDGVAVGAVSFAPMSDTSPTYFFLETAPGVHTYITADVSMGVEDPNAILSRRTLKLEPGKTYYLRVRTTEYFVGGFLEFVAPEEGESAVR